MPAQTIETIVIGLETNSIASLCFLINKSVVDNFFYSRRILDRSIRVIIHQNPVKSVDTEGGVYHNYDVLIRQRLGDVIGSSIEDDKEGISFKELDSKNNTGILLVEMVRLPKSTQQVRIADIAKKLCDFNEGRGLEYFYPLKTARLITTASKPTVRSGSTTGFGKTSHFVIKPEHGARGISQYIFSNDTTPESIITAFIRKNPRSPDQLKSILEDIGGVSFNTKDSEDTFLTPNEYIIQEVVLDIVAEYRIILDEFSRPSWIQLRERKSNSPEHEYLLQASGAGSKIGINQAQYQNPHLDNPEIAEFLSHLPPLHSVDIFFCEKEEGKEYHPWGIFEYSSEMGTTSVDPTYIQQICYGFMDRIVESAIALKES